MKGTLSVSPLFEPLDFRKCKIVLMDPLLLYDDKRLFLEDGKSITWELKPIINATYSKQHGVFLLLCEDWKIYILTETLDLLTKLRWDSKYTVCFRLVESIKAFLMIGVSQIHLAYIDMQCNCKKTKFLSSMKCQITIKDQSPSVHGEAYKHQWSRTVDESTKLKWHKGYDIFQKEDILLVWSLEDVNFYRLRTLQTLSHSEKITKKQIPISKVSYNILYRYAIIGYSNGNIRIWKIPFTQYEKRQLIHTFDYHTRSITDIVATDDARVFLSGSSDCKICLWNIDTFEMVYTYDFREHCNKMFVFDYKTFYAETDENTLMKGTFGIPLELVANVNNGIIYLEKKYQKIQLDESEQGVVVNMQFTLNSNIGLKLDIQDLHQKDVNKSTLQYFYPPLKSKSIQQIIASPFENKYYYLVENGEIYRTRIEGTIAKIETMYDVSSILTSQIASIIKFLRILPPKFDVENMGRINPETQIPLDSLSYEQKDRLFKQKQLLAIGCSKGSVIFLEKQNMSKPYVRISYHRERIIFLDSMFHHDSGKHFLLSMCEENLLKIVTFEDDKSNCVYTVNCERGISKLVCHLDYVFTTFTKGIFQIFKTDDQGHLWYVENEEATDHDDEIVSIDLDRKNHLVLTAGLDQKTKIWNYSKVHILTIIVKQNLHSVYFTNDLNLLIFHQNKLSLLRNGRIPISQKNVMNWKKAEEEQTLLLPFADYLDTIKRKQNKSVRPYRIRSMSREENQYESDKNEKRKKTNMSLVLQPEQKKIRATEAFIRKKEPQKEKDRSRSIQSEIEMLNKHVETINNIRKTNIEHLPRINQNKESLFDQFMRMKLLNKKILTRRDITLNRIIMKNIVKEYMGSETIEGLNGVKAP